MNLPEKYSREMRELLGGEYGEYLASFECAPANGLRVNRRKIRPETFAELSGFPLRKVPWIDNGFYYEGAASAARHPHYYAGLYYIQEPSAMTPASRLPVEPGDRVLDLCAAPGGKATELAARLQGEGYLLANDISASRAGALLKNLELAGIPNFFVTSELPEKLAEKYPEEFDKILVDAPCSGEGMFRRDRHMIAHWETAGPEAYTEVQAEILEQAFRMLRPGGKLLYSTCTFSVRENEEQILRALERHPELSLEPIAPGFEGFAEGCFGMKEAVRLYPHRIEGEGHFLALLKKKGPERRAENVQIKGEPVKSGDLPEAVRDFLEHVSMDLSDMHFRIQKDQIYGLNSAMQVKKGVRYLRTGLLFGTVRKERFEPYQALAMALKKEEFDSVLDLSSRDVRTVKYLKGETISWEKETDGQPGRPSGWQLICTDGFPLGFAKLAGTNLKNKYHPGWRWQ